MSIVCLHKWFQLEKLSLLSVVYIWSEHREHFKCLLDQQKKKPPCICTVLYQPLWFLGHFAAVSDYLDPAGRLWERVWATLGGGETGSIAGRGDWRGKGNPEDVERGYRETITVREGQESRGCYRFCWFFWLLNPLLWHVKGMWRCKTTGINK